MAAVSLVDEHRQFIKAEVGIGLTGGAALGVVLRAHGRPG